MLSPLHAAMGGLDHARFGYHDLIAHTRGREGAA
jgi:hypothetical protein